MPKPARKKLKLTEESLNELYQELYNENHNLKNKTARLFLKLDTLAKGQDGAALLGEQIIKAVNLELGVHDKKINLLKVVKDVIRDKNALENKKSKDVGDENKPDITENEKNELFELIEKTKKR